MASALIGHTGFVGSNISRQEHFDDFYNSKNADDIKGKEYELVVCAWAPGTKWLANRSPNEDFASIERLINNLSSMKAKTFVLISTVDIYASPFDVDEDSLILVKGLHSYGRHRRMLEEFVESHFDCTIIRLPGLFGKGLRKNIIFDILNGNNLHLINPKGVFQFYNLNNIARDIKKTLGYGIELLNLATEPVSVSEILEATMYSIPVCNPGSKAPYYDVRSKFACCWTGSRNYEMV